MASPARRLTPLRAWVCPHCPYEAPVDSLLPEHIARHHPDHDDEGDE